ncbi:MULTISPECIES: type IV pilus twitching motility protein PilT [unclassified Pseudomonas]|uniref:type IV pilus twitching motility protein PilT n=1 Tax=unclassified Pseudomonas TaxID=196821 RepID=UPI0008393777|nr:MULTISPECIES: type IV pilus twitching motility protein PilT [unclassified Pseudomonas]QIH11475.1 type IV pilus twitching motility protein PilT [Pseudomonas sp. BIOMIG1BAC]
MDITELLLLSVSRGASDLHLSAGLAPRLRIDGDICPLDSPALEGPQVLAMIHGLMSQAQRDAFASLQDLDFAYELPGVARFRVNAFQHARGAGAVLRLVPSQVQSLEVLGLGQVLRQIAEVPRGLVLVTGPTGSGKSTTLAAMIDHLNRSRRQHIITIEDPIEFIHPQQACLVHQREVQRDTRSFASALRAALREDPDVILLGELRDLETIRLALTAAETGHLVFATLHTSSAAKTIDRLVDVFPGEEKALVRSMLAESLQAVIAQVLLKRVGGGRVAACEIMLGTAAIRNLIREDKVAQMYSAIQTGGAQGMQTLDMSLKMLVGQGLISREQAREKARVPEGF